MSRETLEVNITAQDTVKGQNGVAPAETFRSGYQAIQTAATTAPIIDRRVVTGNEIAPLGQMIVRTDIQSLSHSHEGRLERASFNVFPEYRTQYPEVVTQALGNLYAEYNQSFRPLVAGNREWGTDYQHSIAPDGTPINGWVQIDMVGLPDRFLQAASGLPEAQVREILRGNIFEIENSLAMYQLLGKIFSDGQQDTFFRRQFHASLDDLRVRHGKPIALLAVTDQKHQAMKESEFGKQEGEPLTDAEVRKLSGFDRFFSPDEFQRYLAENGGECGYLLYARTSDPVSKLRKPDITVEVPLLEDDNYRRIIKANSVTFNVDNPAWPAGNPRRINDTKAWMPAVGMAHPIFTIQDLFSEEGVKYLMSQGVDPHLIKSQEAKVRVKPMQGAYGGYGHQRAEVGNKKFISDVKRDLCRRGPYVMQPEMTTPIVTNAVDGSKFTYIDRDFFYIDVHGQPQFMGGFRSLMPISTQEAERGRVHGNGSTVWAEIH